MLLNALGDLSKDYIKARNKCCWKGDFKGMDRDYKLCINCVHLPYDHLWKALEHHETGVCYLKCKKDILTFDLSTKPENCYYWKLQPVSKIRRLIK